MAALDGSTRVRVTMRIGIVVETWTTIVADIATANPGEVLMLGDIVSALEREGVWSSHVSERVFTVALDVPAAVLAP